MWLSSALLAVAVWPQQWGVLQIVLNFPSSSLAVIIFLPGKWKEHARERGRVYFETSITQTYFQWGNLTSLHVLLFVKYVLLLADQNVWKSKFCSNSSSGFIHVRQLMHKSVKPRDRKLKPNETGRIFVCLPPLNNVGISVVKNRV